MATILCMKWGTKYGPEYVNRLHSMVRRHLTIPHRFVCLTDNREGLHADIETFPIPSLELPAGAPERDRGFEPTTADAAPLADGLLELCHSAA